MGVPVGIAPPRFVWKTRMAWLPDGEKISKISLFVLAQLTNVTDTHADRHTPHDGIGRGYASHRAAKTVHRVTRICTGTVCRDNV